jgi:hypothetical protein
VIITRPFHGPDIVRQHDGEAGRHDDQAAEKGQRPARQKFLGQIAKRALVGEHGKPDHEHDRPDQPRDKNRI